MQNETLFVEINAILQCDYFLVVSLVLQKDTPHEQILQRQLGINYLHANIILGKMMADGFIGYCPDKHVYFKKINLTEWYDLVTAVTSNGYCKYSEIYENEAGVAYRTLSYKKAW